MSKVDYPVEVLELVAQLKRLPGVGPRSAERVAVWMIQHKKRNPLELAAALESAEREVELCPDCGFFATQSDCSVCNDSGRDSSILCVVEQATDVLPLERSGAFSGSYHCLGGKLSPLDDITPADLRIGRLIQRVEETPDVEVILALSSDVEGEATANYLAEVLQAKQCKVTRIAQGLPAGGGLEHADELTLLRALQGRR